MNPTGGRVKVTGKVSSCKGFTEGPVEESQERRGDLGDIVSSRR